MFYMYDVSIGPYISQAHSRGIRLPESICQISFCQKNYDYQTKHDYGHSKPQIMGYADITYCSIACYSNICISCSVLSVIYQPLQPGFPIMQNRPAVLAPTPLCPSPATLVTIWPRYRTSSWLPTLSSIAQAKQDMNVCSAVLAQGELAISSKYGEQYHKKPYSF